MRTHSTQDDQIFKATGQATYFRLDLQGDDLAYYAITAQRGYSFLNGGTRKRDVDTPIITMSLDVPREIFKLSLAPLMVGSVLNQLGSSTQLLRPNRRIRLYSQLQPAGAPADASAWTLIFDGVIDTVDSGKKTISLGCSDLARRVQQKFIKDERSYGVWQPGQRYIGDSTVGAVVIPTQGAATYPNKPEAPTGPWFRAQGTGVAAANNWTASTSTTAGTVRTPTIPNGRVYTSGSGTHTTGTTEPAWPTTVGATILDGSVTWTCGLPTEPTWPNSVGATVVDNGITWRCEAVAGGTPTATPLETQIQMLLDDNLGGWTLYTPTPSSEVIRPYTQKGGFLLQALQSVADVIGWNVRWKWDDGTSAYRLTLFDPGRGNTTSLATLSPSKHREIEVLSISTDDVRTTVDVWFWDGSTVDADGNPVLSKVTSKNQAAIDLYGELYMAVSEGAAAGIQTAALAQKMADAIQGDLSQAPILVQVPIEFAWWFELGDIVTLTADGLHYDSDQKLAVFSIDDKFGGGSDMTTLGLRGKPSTGNKRWLQKIAMPGLNQGPIKFLNALVPATMTVTQTIGGAKFEFAIPSGKEQRYENTELHISTLNGFVPDASTRKQRGHAGSFVVNELTPGTQYYGKPVHHIRGQPSVPGPQVSFVAGYAGLPAIDPAISQNAQFLLTLDANFTAGTDFVVPLNGTDFARGITLSPLLPSPYCITCNGAASGATGNLIVMASATIEGVSPGDMAKLVLQGSNNGGVTWTDVRSGKWTGVEPGNVAAIEPTLDGIVPLVALTNIYRFVIRSTPASGTPTWTAISVGSTAKLGTRIGFAQTLS